jgi:AraC-like DNA-binding protein
LDNLTQQDPHWGIEVPSITYASAHGPIATACMSAGTVADSMEILAQYAHQRAPYFRLRRRTRGDFCALRVEPLVDLDSPRRRPVLESLLLSLQGVVESTLQRPMEEGRIDIAGPRTPEASRYGSVFHSPVRFNAGASAVAVPREWLSKRNPLADAAALADALSTLESMERHFQRGHSIVRGVERILRQREDVPSLGGIAAILHLSRRTLERGLKRSNTSYRALVEEARRQRAERLLKDDTLTIAEVAYRVGYTDPANFARACRRWLGMSPSEYRDLNMPPQ